MYEEELKTAYNKLKDLNPNFKIEDWDIVALVHKYRMFWKPEKVKTLLLAESHVFTEKELIKEKFTLPTELINYPKEYVRFVYCLAYGEHRLLTNKRKSGTPQFWKLFNDCVKEDHKVTNNKDATHRINEKVKLLEQMRNDSLWLLDCSIIAIYDAAKKPAKKDSDQILTTSFENYCLPIIKAERPEKIIVIGKTVYNLVMLLFEKIRNENKNENKWIDEIEICWIYQPNAHIKKGDRKTISSLIHKFV